MKARTPNWLFQKTWSNLRVSQNCGRVPLDLGVREVRRRKIRRQEPQDRPSPGRAKRFDLIKIDGRGAGVSASILHDVP
jgi:hypothetical protein